MSPTGVVRRSGGVRHWPIFAETCRSVAFQKAAAHYDQPMSTATANAVPPVPLRQDAGVIGLVGLAHMISHFSQLLLAPLFPWLKDAFNASYTELGFLMTVFFVVSCAVQAASGFLVDRYGPRPILFGGPGAAGRCRIRFRAQPQLLGHGAVFASWPASATASSTRWTTRCSIARSARRGWAMRTASTASPAAWAGRWRRRCWCRWRSLSRGASRLMGAGALAFGVLAVLWLNRDQLALPALRRAKWRIRVPRAASGRQLRLPAHPGRVDVLRLLLLLRRRAQRDPGVRARGRAATAWRAGGAGGDVPHRLHGVQRRRHGARRLPGGRPGALRAGGRHRALASPPRSRWSSAWAPSRRWPCRRCSAPWVSPAASPGHRATCW